MVPSERLLDILCGLRRVCYARVDREWRLHEIGGITDDWPELTPGADLREAIPEVGERIEELGREVTPSERFVLRWLQRDGPTGRHRFYELVLHPVDEGDDRLCWLMDRSAYGRLKVRIDRHYRQLVGERKSEPETDPFSSLDPDLTR